MAIVALVKCDSYDYCKVLRSVHKGISLLGGVERFVSPHEKILLKPNILTGADPDRCITTHPNVFRAVAEVFKPYSAGISYGDNPGVISPLSGAKKAGFSEVARQLNISFGNFSSTREVHFKNGRHNQTFNIVQAVFDSDGIISLPKFKTHTLTKITGSVKNQFGCLPFFEKRVLHAKLPNAVDFARMLLDLNQCIHPRLYIMDSIFAMDGDGPVSGNPFKLSVLGFSSNPIALDSVMCRIICLDPAIVPTILYGHKFGYGEFEESKIKLIGDKIEDFVNRDFKIERTSSPKEYKRSLTGKIITSIIKEPVVIKSKCVKCGNCAIACPVEPKAIGFKDGNCYPEINYNKCIRCYCCCEMCLENAITLRKPIYNFLSLDYALFPKK